MRSSDGGLCHSQALGWSVCHRRKLATLTKSGALSHRTVILASVALCGFANLLSIGIQIGGIGMMAPDRRSEIARMGFKAMAIGGLANILAAAICGLFL